MASHRLDDANRKAGAAGSTDQSKGVVVFVRPRGGAMAEASVGGQRLTVSPLSTN
jgi:hypothetical protein